MPRVSQLVPRAFEIHRRRKKNGANIIHSSTSHVNKCSCDCRFSHLLLFYHIYILSLLLSLFHIRFICSFAAFFLLQNFSPSHLFILFLFFIRFMVNAKSYYRLNASTCFLFRRYFTYFVLPTMSDIFARTLHSSPTKKQKIKKKEKFLHFFIRLCRYITHSGSRVLIRVW